GGEQATGQEEPVAKREHPCVQHDVPEHPAARHQGIDALGAVPLERIAAAVAAEVEAEHSAHFGEARRVHEVLDDGVAVLLDGAGVRLEIETHAASRTYMDSIRSL